ncbi:hypothetical protein BCR39DRAFT_511850 [Naematelia encephala]|uniref:THUMP domain-containing protein n=1 Tax=Naematelia encephala TaxID=71784 RepID=A0A1Y2BM42_9TREE|nr:hypothetical protein BCR39DRAFT_511850 [Naematelia encephala]
MSQAGGSQKQPQKNKSVYKRGDNGRGGSRGSRGGGGRGGRGGWGGGGRGGRGGGRGGSSQQWTTDVEPALSHLGRYRDDPIAEMMTGPGIVATAIQNKERSAERELVQYLERIADELYPETAQGDGSTEGEDLDVEEALKRELAGMSGDGEKSKRFRLCRHDTICVIYIKVLAPLDAYTLVQHILQNVESSGKCPFKYVRRIVPIQATGNATMNSLTSTAEPVIQQAFNTPESSEGLRFAIVTNKRNSNRMDRMEMIKAIADLVVKAGSAHKVDLNDPERTILVEIYKNSLGVSVVSNYTRFKKFNPWELAEHLAKGKAASESTTIDTNTNANTAPAPAPSTEPTTAPQSRSAQNQAARSERAAQLKLDTTDTQSVIKRKVEDAELEEGEQTITAEDVEGGEVVEDERAELGEGFEEVIEGGRVLKMRKVEE